MEVPRLNKSVVRVVQLQKTAAGDYSPVVVYEKPGRKKRMSGPLQPLEKVMRRVASAQSSFADKYLDKHNRSNEKKRDGWVRDMVPNVLDAAKAGKKKLKIKRLVFG